MASIYIYKIWYIAAGLVLLISVGFICAHQLKFTGLFKALGFILVYFGLLLLTSAWAVRPELTRSWVAIDSIQVVVFLLFWLLALNHPPDRLFRFFSDLLLGAFAVAIVLWFLDPHAERQGGRAPHLVACLLPFCAIRLGARPNWKILACVLAGLAIVILSMSRTPLLGTAVGFALVPFFISSTPLQFLRAAGIFLGIGLLAVITILSFDTSRTLAVQTFSRVSETALTVHNVPILKGNLVDEGREAIQKSAGRLFWENLPLGIGYMNYPAFFEFHYGKAPGGSSSLHNSYQTWGLETGLPGMLVVGLLLYRYFRILSRRTSQTGEREEKAFGKACVIAMVSLLVMGLFFQIHQSPALFLLLGMVYSFESEKRIRRRIVWQRD